VVEKNKINMGEENFSGSNLSLSEMQLQCLKELKEAVVLMKNDIHIISLLILVFFILGLVGLLSFMLIGIFGRVCESLNSSFRNNVFFIEIHHFSRYFHCPHTRPHFLRILKIPNWFMKSLRH